jgi:hypothetical protein
MQIFIYAGTNYAIRLDICKIQQTMYMHRKYKERHLAILRKGCECESHLNEVISEQIDLALGHQEESA